MENILIIQARMSSKRLPGKVLLPLGDTTVLANVVERSKLIKGVDRIIVAVPDTEDNDVLVTWCESNKVEWYAGPEDNILQRFMNALSPYNPRYILRVTADCPYLDYETASNSLTSIMETKEDVLIYKGTQPRGTVVEIISYKALKRIHNSNDLQDKDKEHVTYYAYVNSNKFSSLVVDVPSNIAGREYRITLDTEEDYSMLAVLADLVGDSLTPTYKVVGILDSRPELVELNIDVVQKVVI